MTACRVSSTSQGGSCIADFQALISIYGLKSVLFCRNDSYLVVIPLENRITNSPVLILLIEKGVETMALNFTPPGTIQQQNSSNSNDTTSRILYDVWVHRFGSHLEQKNAREVESTLQSHSSSVSSLGTPITSSQSLLICVFSTTSPLSHQYPNWSSAKGLHLVPFFCF